MMIWPLPRATALAITALSAAVLLGCGERAPSQAGPGVPVVQANDNRDPAGRLRRGELDIRMAVQMARWYPESDSGPAIDVAAFAEEGHAPQIPAPLIRVPAGTTIAATIRNALPDSTIYLHGFGTRPDAADDSIAIPPGESRLVRFSSGAPGTYMYRATAGTIDNDVREREQLVGALVIDSANARTDDRIFVINIWGEPPDSVSYRNALAINGKSWPHTERITAEVGDSLRWRIVNGSVREHPMHLHGFHFRINSRGALGRDTLLGPAQRRQAVTEEMPPLSTMSLVWQVERAGNWLFHCHIGFHVVPGTRLDPPAGNAHDWHAQDAGKHMAGLVLGITARERPGSLAESRDNVRQLRLYVNEGRRHGRVDQAMGFVLQNGNAPPARDSVEIPGTLLTLTRGEPTDITVVNQLREPTSVHWHGIELESFSDGVAGWSGAGQTRAPIIAPGDSFTARLTLPRAGTFMYHTHLNDLKQLSYGLYGALVVLEPGVRFDPASDHVFVVGWDGPDDPPHFLVNGDSVAPPITVTHGTTHRLRFVNIGSAWTVQVKLERDTTLAAWRPLAKDGADLPSTARTMQPASAIVAVGETFDFEFAPPARGTYLLSIVPVGEPPAYTRRIIVRQE
jgi:FtsP/CotA-like multicopper oxidase with cupredoxin domain